MDRDLWLRMCIFSISFRIGEIALHIHSSPFHLKFWSVQYHMCFAVVIVYKFLYMYTLPINFKIEEQRHETNLLLK